MRFSTQRKVIRDIVKSTKTHPSADWIFNKARVIMPNISLGTVYRNLKYLEKIGEINTISDDQIIRYDGNTKAHHHLKCTRCGDLIDINNYNNIISKKFLGKYKFIIKKINLMILGECQKHNITNE
tara:strand:- start:911 stop:1288 length:378 start_codon:yes stop_codon:yes gene_type:complete